MKNVRWIALVGLVGMSMGAALAQPGGGMGPGGGPGAGRWGADHTPGWAMMTAEERTEHRARMGAMKTYEECKTYHSQHHEQMMARAKERGGKALAQPRRDPCAGMKK